MRKWLQGKVFEFFLYFTHFWRTEQFAKYQKGANLVINLDIEQIKKIPFQGTVPPD